ncbi:ATP-binding protein [Robbsia sp. Bb-Pol-6]|uniref:histidine kinase n=1 Tax=Robbsia betulipollinis TaxID=2981849 RepID=A0ABT3ZTE8_9BURK|nr:ATP-binding protein [Robbsia betulipollinis]MCY0389826.1 ATP-binding protein [Robbsia betulipollinis]
MSAAAILDDPIRLERLRAFGILDTLSEPHFDSLAQMAARLVRMPMALINFVDEARTWCKAAWGCERRSIVRDHSLCASALLRGDALVLPDVREDAHFKTHPCKVGDLKVASYAAIVLKTDDGVRLGTLCVADRIAREMDEQDLAALQLVAQQVVKHLEARRTDARVADLEAQLDAAQRHRDQFLAMLAHELRAPLAPILTGVRILHHAEVTEDQRAWAKKLIYRHVGHMSEIVDHLLSASLVSFGSVELHLEPTPLARLIEQAVEMHQATLDERHQVLHCEIDGDPWVAADRTQCPLVISNLLMNASQYTANGGRIDIVANASDKIVTVRVRDTGIGIDPADMDEIFQIFGQSKQPLDRSKGGMGLGLPLARRLAEWHGGSLTASSAGPGCGSEFLLTLRRAVPGEAMVSANVVGQKTMRPLDILIVEDNADTADALALYYEMSGHRVRVANRASDAIARLGEQQPDVVLSDIGLPDTDGYALVQKLRAMNPSASTAFIAITGYASEKDKEAATLAGFRAHFAKPVDLAKLDRVLSRLQNTQPGTDTSRPLPS